MFSNHIVRCAPGPAASSREDRAVGRGPALYL